MQRSPERGGARAQARGWPPSTGGLQGPRGRGGLCLRSSALGRRQPGYKMAGKGWDRGLSPRGAAPLSLLCRGGGAGVLAPLRPRPPLPPQPVTQGPCPHRLGLGLQPPPRSAEPRPQQLQKMAAKAAPVATLPRAGTRAAAHPQPLSLSPARGLSSRAPGPSRAPGEQRKDRERAGRRRGGYLPGEGAMGCGWQGDSAGRALSVCPHPACPCPREDAAPSGEMLMGY